MSYVAVQGEHGRIVISTYPERAKTANARRDPRVSILVLSDDFTDFLTLPAYELIK